MASFPASRRGQRSWKYWFSYRHNKKILPVDIAKDADNIDFHLEIARFSLQPEVPRRLKILIFHLEIRRLVLSGWCSVGVAGALRICAVSCACDRCFADVGGVLWKSRLRCRCMGSSCLFTTIWLPWLSMQEALFIAHIRTDSKQHRWWYLA